MILHQFIDYETLRIIWWLLLGVLLIGFAVTDGFDLGTATLLPFVAKTDLERRVVINSIGPTWEGNQVWLILGGGAIFAAWPPLYAVSFSGFYLAMFAILFALILRPVGFKYRSKRDDATWRNVWDWALFVGGAVPSLIFGVAVGNVLQGVAFHFNNDLRIFYDGTTLFELLNPFGLLCGLLSVAMLVMHGSAWLVLKTEGVVADRARAYGSIAALVTAVLFVLGGISLWVGIDGYHITSPVNPLGPSNPLAKTVAKAAGAWFENYGTHPWMVLAPTLGVAGAGAAFAFMGARREIACDPGDLAFDIRHHIDRRPRDVSLYSAVVGRSAFEPDGLGRFIQPHDAFHHAGGDGDLLANSPRLHDLGLPCDVGQG